MNKGIGVFGRQYEIMFRNDPHAAGSVDRILTEQMIKLDHLYNALAWSFLPSRVRRTASGSFSSRTDMRL